MRDYSSRKIRACSQIVRVDYKGSTFLIYIHILQIATLNQEDIQQTAPYKTLVVLAEHLASDVARLESSNEKLLQENTSLLSERIKFKEDVNAEHRKAIEEANDQIQRLEKDLTRVRGVRDELHHEVQNRKAREDETLHSAREISEIADSREVSSFTNHFDLRCVSSLWRKR